MIIYSLKELAVRWGPPQGKSGDFEVVVKVRAVPE
jgi:hypothetical protein